MDGGVYDNQGVFSILNILGLTYDSRRDREKKGDGYIPRDINLAGMFGGGGRQEPAEHRANDIDLFIVSDTPLRDIPIYEMGKQPQKAGWLDLEKLKWIISITLVLLIGSTLFMGYAYFSTLLSGDHQFGNWQDHIWDMFIYVIPLLLLLVCVGGGIFLMSRLKEYFGSQPTFQNNPELRPGLWKYFKKRKFSDLGYMIESRLSSAIAMSSDVFMNRIRFLGLARVFNLPPLKGKVIINVIDSLIRDKRMIQDDVAQSEAEKKIISELLEGAEMLCNDTVSKAATVGTQFWLAREDMADLLVCGQATMCYNLLRHMDVMKVNDSPQAESDHFKKLYEQVAGDWEQLKANPYYLMDDPYLNLM